MLRSLEVEVIKPTKFYSDNKSTCTSIVADESLCNKKHVSIAFYETQEAVLAKITHSYHMRSEENSIKFLIKALDRNKYNLVTNRVLK